MKSHLRTAKSAHPVERSVFPARAKAAPPKRAPLLALAGGIVLLGLGAGGGLMIFSLGVEDETALATGAPPVAKPTGPVIVATSKPAPKIAALQPSVEKPDAIAVASPPSAAAPAATSPAVTQTAKLPAAELPQNNDRWARDAEGALPAVSSEAPAEANPPKATADGAEPDDVLAYASPDDPSADPTPTAAIPPEQQTAIGRNPLAPEAEAKPQSGRNGVIAHGVNLRTRPDDDSKVLLVVPAKASVQVLGCKAWCEIVYKGSRGWIYKSFLAGQGGGRQASKAAANKQSATFPVEPKATGATGPKEAQGLPGVFSTDNDR